MRTCLYGGIFCKLILKLPIDLHCSVKAQKDQSPRLNWSRTTKTSTEDFKKQDQHNVIKKKSETNLTKTSVVDHSIIVWHKQITSSLLYGVSRGLKLLWHSAGMLASFSPYENYRNCLELSIYSAVSPVRDLNLNNKRKNRQNDLWISAQFISTVLLYYLSSFKM